MQQYIEAPTPHITRVEFVGQSLLYAVRVDTSQGFQLCPADVCEVPADGATPAGEKFVVLDEFEHPLVARYEQFLRDQRVHVAAFEFVEGRSGRCYTYDLNTNTNYNAAAESRVGRSGMRTLAAYLGRELASAQAIGGRAAKAA